MEEAVLTRAVRVRASHHYGRPDWDAARNARTFGQQTAIHEHHYRFEASWRGPIDPELGFILDLSQVDRLLEERLVQPLEGRVVNEVVPAFGPGGRQPSTEELARWAWGELSGAVQGGVTLIRVRVGESDTLWADYHGPGRAGGGG